MTIFCDMDNVICDLSKNINEWGKKLGYLPQNAPYPYEVSYNLAETIFGHLENGAEVVDEIFRTKYFWLSIPVKPDADYGVRYLNDNHQLYIVTTPWDDYSPCIEEKRAWIAKHFPYIDIPSQMIFIKDKFLLSAPNSMLIEDSPTNIAQWKGDLTIIMDYPYNEDVRVGAMSYLRVKDWLTIKNFVEVFDESVKEGLELRRKWKNHPLLSLVKSS